MQPTKFMRKTGPILTAERLPKIHGRVAAWLLMGALLTGIQVKAAEPAAAVVPRVSGSLEQNWGVQVTSLHLSANGYMVDFRYKVVEPEKAATLGDPKAKSYLIDQATGARLLVPRTPKVGPLRQSAERLTAGKVYFTLFSNRNRIVKSGSKVTVVVGDFRAENLVVE